MIWGRHLAARSARDSDGCFDAQNGDLLQLVRQGVDVQLLDRLQLPPRGLNRALDVRFVRIREPVGICPGAGHDRVLVEPKRRLARSGKGKQIGDRLASLRVRDRVRASFEGGERHSLPGSDLAEQVRAVDSACPQLEMRGIRAGERAAAEHGPAEVGTAAARSPDHVLRRPFERCPSR